MDKWLFDKGLTYAQVAEGCQKFFGVKVSKSSVARYCDRELMEQMARKRSEQRAKEGAGVSDLHARLTPDEGYQLLIQRVMRLANEAAERVQFSQRYEGFLDRREFRWFLRLMRLLIAARREKNMGIRVQAERAKMEIEVAKACLNLRRGNTQKESVKTTRFSFIRKYSLASKNLKSSKCKTNFMRLAGKPKENRGRERRRGRRRGRTTAVAEKSRWQESFPPFSHGKFHPKRVGTRGL